MWNFFSGWDSSLQYLNNPQQQCPAIFFFFFFSFWTPTDALFTVCIPIGSKGQDQTRLNQTHISLWPVFWSCGNKNGLFPKWGLFRKTGISWQGRPKFRFQTPHWRTNPNSADQFLLTQLSEDQMLVKNWMISRVDAGSESTAGSWVPIMWLCKHIYIHLLWLIRVDITPVSCLFVLLTLHFSRVLQSGLLTDLWLNINLHEQMIRCSQLWGLFHHFCQKAIFHFTFMHRRILEKGAASRNWTLLLSSITISHLRANLFQYCLMSKFEWREWRRFSFLSV